MTQLSIDLYNISVPVINSSWTQVLISASEHGYVWAKLGLQRGQLPSAYDDCDKNPHTKHDTTLDRPVYNISVPVINSSWTRVLISASEHGYVLAKLGLHARQVAVCLWRLW